MIQTILGSGGAIGTELAKSLINFTDQIRLVSRNPVKVNPGDELVSADLLNKEQVNFAVKGSEIVYLVVGLPYSLKIWREQWPIVMQNVIDACKEHQSKLVFFDNIYMIDPIHMANITEDSPINPISKKGKVRAQLVNMIFEEINSGNLNALIARAADFYGPNVTTSVLQETVYKNLLNGKSANWFCSFDKLHNFTFTPDAGKATAILGNDPNAFNQVWNLPTAKPLTGNQWIEAFAIELDVKPKKQLAPRWLVWIMGLFMPIMKEFVEMLYQYDRDYVFNSDKFCKTYDFQTTTIENGIKMVIEEGNE